MRDALVVSAVALLDGEDHSSVFCILYHVSNPVLVGGTQKNRFDRSDRTNSDFGSRAWLCSLADDNMGSTIMFLSQKPCVVYLSTFLFIYPSLSRWASHRSWKKALCTEALMSVFRSARVRAFFCFFPVCSDAFTGRVVAERTDQTKYAQFTSAAHVELAFHGCIAVVFVHLLAHDMPIALGRADA